MNTFFDFTRGVFGGKTLGRIMFNWQVEKTLRDLTGSVLDLAGGESASYLRYLPQGLKVIKTDYKQNKNVDIIVDLNKKLQFPDESIPNIFLFNSLYIIKNRISLLREINRILKKGGLFFLSTPLIVGEIPEPNDYCRLTYQGVSEELRGAGFINFEIRRIGGRFSSAASLLHPFYYFNFIRFVVYALALFLDKITINRQTKSPAPLGYFCIIRK